MHLVLKPFYTVKVSDGQIIFTDFINDTHVFVNVKRDFDSELLIQLLINGLSIANVSDLQSIEEKIVIHLYKNTKNIFELYDQKQKKSKAINMRAVLQTAILGGVEPKEAEKYITLFDETKLIMITSRQDELLEFLRSQGIENISFALSIKEAQHMSDNNHIFLMDENRIDSTPLREKDICLLFSMTRLQIGPILIPGKTACMNCYLASREETTEMPNGTVPEYYNIFIYNFLVNIIYYLKGNLYRGIYNDVGLPIKKFYTLIQPELNIKVTNLYKRISCVSCMN
ncbi:hypothetical protein [Paenibacillus sp. TSA_86.1]|uniref:hypothetical protein n=1 Tax=Paenibacillus sp. TSA_86.1 TaxID=3415649 RepID=UPI004045F96D